VLNQKNDALKLFICFVLMLACIGLSTCVNGCATTRPEPTPQCGQSDLPVEDWDNE